jgi:hypothetical protein
VRPASASASWPARHLVAESLVLDAGARGRLGESTVLRWQRLRRGGLVVKRLMSNGSAPWSAMKHRLSSRRTDEKCPLGRHPGGGLLPESKA